MNKNPYTNAYMAAVIVFAVQLTIYGLTLAPTFLHIDCGELVAAQWLLGIAHPTGYPLFTLLGHLFLKIPLFDRPVVQANWLSAIWTAGGVALFAIVLYRHLLNIAPPGRVKQPDAATNPASGFFVFIISIAAALMLGCSLTVWAQANAAEVYSLQVCLFSTILLALQNAYHYNTIKAWMWASVAVGLGFSNHMTTMMVLPLAAVVYFSKNGLSIEALRKLIKAAVPGLLVMVLMYAFLFYRAGMDPVLNWGNIHDFTTLKRHITGHQYSSWIFAGAKVAARNLGEFLKYLPAEWGYIGIFLIVMGISKVFTLNRVWAFAFTVGMLFNIIYVINYDIKDLEPYFLLALMSMAFFIGYGFWQIYLLLSHKPKWLVYLILFAFPMASLFANYSKSDNSSTRFFETYTEAALQQVEPNALILTEQWDFFITPFYYLNLVEGKYKQVTVVDKALLRRSWYVGKQLDLFDPDALAGSGEERSRFLEALKPFEDGRPFNGAYIEEQYQALITSILTHAVQKRPVYIGRELFTAEPIRLPRGYKVIPQGFWYKLVPSTAAYVPFKLMTFKPYFPKNWSGKDNYYSSFIKNAWITACEQRAAYEQMFGNIEIAAQWEAAKVLE
jgi:hypothetical protein